MAIGITDDKHYIDIANTLRNRLDSPELTFKPEDMANAINQVYQHGYETSQAECQAMHFNSSILGSGSKKLSIPMPFMPDTLYVYSSNPYSGSVMNSISGFMVDFRACGGVAGIAAFSSSHNILGTGAIRPSAFSTMFSYSDGVFSFEGSTAMASLVWRPNARYTVIAAKYPAEDGKNMLIEEINQLPDQVPSGHNGELTYYLAAVNRYLTTEEWEELIDKKPNWNFIMQ